MWLMCFVLLLSSDLLGSLLAYSRNALISESILHLRERGMICRLKAINSITTKEQLDAITIHSTSSTPVVIDFQKSACKPCVRIAPLYLELSTKYESSVSFYKVDADSSVEALALLKQEGIRSVPTFHIWSGGRRIDVIRGAYIDEVEDIIRGEVAKLSSNTEDQASLLALKQRLDLAKQLNDLST